MSSPGAPPAWPHGRHWVQLSPWFWANLPSSPLFHFRVPAAPTPSPPSPASRLLCNMEDRSNRLCTLLADTVGSPAQSPISCRLLSHFSGHLVPCLPMPRGAGGCEATPAHHATLALLLPAQPRLSLLPAAFMHLSPVAGWTLPHPYLFSSTPSLGASLCPLGCVPQALARGSQITERWEEACPQLSTKAVSGPRQALPAGAESTW